MEKVFKSEVLNEEFKDSGFEEMIKRLNEISHDIKTLDKVFRSFPVPISVEIDPNRSIRFEGNRLHYVDTEKGVLKPLIQCDRFIRLEASKYFSELIRVAKKGIQDLTGGQ